MALKISRLKLYTPPAPPPEPLYALRIKAALKLMHPLFQFTLERLDISTTIDFTVSFRELLMHGQVVTPADKPFLFGTFPGFLFDRDAAEGEAFAIHDSMRRFEQYLFKVITRYLFDVVHQSTVKERALMGLLQAGQIDWVKTVRYLNLATCKLTMFSRQASPAESEDLDLFLIPGEWEVRLPGGLLQPDRPCLATNVIGLSKATLQAQVDEILAAEGADKANWHLKNHLQKLIVANLYHMQWKPL